MTLDVGTQKESFFTFYMKLFVSLCLQLYLGCGGGMSDDMVFAVVMGGR